MLKALGKYINNNGLEEAFTESEIYGLATLEEANNGKHMKRSFEVNATLYVVLFCMYVECFVSLHPLIEKELRARLVNVAVVAEKFTRK